MSQVFCVCFLVFGRMLGRGQRGRDGIDEAMTPEQLAREIKQLEQRMFQHARELEFEEAARVRDQIGRLRAEELGLPERIA